MEITLYVELDTAEEIFTYLELLQDLIKCQVGKIQLQDELVDCF